jgi:DNA-binding MarR family transcriptional regulator
VTAATPSVPQVIASLRALAESLDHLDEVAAALYGLNRTDMRALDIVGRSGPIAPTALARRLGFTTGGITTVIDRLEKAGYVRRQQNPSDRRRLVVEVTESTRRQDQAVFAGLGRSIGQLVEGYPAKDLRAIKDFLDKSEAITAGYCGDLATADAGSSRRRR